MEAINFTLEQFRSVMLAAGYDEVTERSWEPNTTLDVHTHPFDANAIVVSGYLWL
nr:AraC family transcriptional regulator [Oxalobacteraceae bacterium]